MRPADTRAMLLAQHEELRRTTARLCALAQELRDGQAVGSAFDAALDDLRTAFAEHNATESAVIGELMVGAGDRGSRFIDRMLEEHGAEHGVFWKLMSGSRREVAERIDELAEELDAHMAAEERTFLSPAAIPTDALPRK
jgi:hypothetical protein